MLDRLLNKRTLVVILCTVFLLSSASLISVIFPSSTSSWSLQSYISSSEGTSSLADAVNADLADADDDAPEEEDLVQVNTAPTKADAWQPKQFEPLSPGMISIINRNVKKEKKDKVLLTAVANSGMAEYTLNWIESLKRTNLADKYLVFAIDQKLVDEMTAHGYASHVVLIPEGWYHQKLSPGFAKWLDKSYTPITHAKSLVVERLLYDDITVWFSDVDIVFNSPEMYTYLIEKLNSRRSATETLFTQETEQKIINSGFYIMRPTNTNKRILSDSIVIQDNEPSVTQQRAINRVLDEMDLSYQTSPIALLDLALFPHGRLYFERNIPMKYGMQPMIVHANYRVGPEKKKALQRAGLWYLQ